MAQNEMVRQLNDLKRAVPSMVPEAQSYSDYAPKPRPTEAGRADYASELAKAIGYTPDKQIADIIAAMPYRAMKKMAAQILAVKGDLTTAIGIADALDEWANSCHQEGAVQTFVPHE